MQARGGVLHLIFGKEVQHAMTIWTPSYLRFCKNEGSKRSKKMKKGVNKIENQGEIYIWYIMKQNCQMTDFGEKLGQL